MKTNYLKLGVLSLMLLAGTAIQAQQTDATAATGGIAKIEDAGKSKALNGTIRVIDNKGTKKFLQVQNGLTLLTNEAPDGGIVSTWQLGGTLNDATNIETGANEFKVTLDTGGTFVIDGLVAPAAADVAATSATIGTSGYTVLIRDEATGQVKKMLISELVEGGSKEVASADAAFIGSPTIADASIPADVNKISVYRNGAKLRAGTDYTAVAGTITLVPQTASPNDWALYVGDFIEAQWVK